MEQGTKLASIKSPWSEWLQEWKDKGKSSIRFFSQRRAILHDPMIVHHATASEIPGWKSPLSFAVAGSVFVTIAISCISFGSKYLLRIPEDNPFSQSLTYKVMDHLNPIFFNLTVIFAAASFKKGVIKDYGASEFTKVSDSSYLYVITARYFWLNLIVNIFFEGFRLTNIDTIAGFLGFIYLLSVPISFSAMYLASGDLYKVINISRPANLWTRANKVFNRMFWSGIKTFFIVALIALVIAFALSFVETNLL